LRREEGLSVGIYLDVCVFNKTKEYIIYLYRIYMREQEEWRVELCKFTGNNPVQDFVMGHL
jgi:hypothetical protein